MLDAGMKAQEIARKLNRSAQAIYARLQRTYRKQPATHKPSAGLWSLGLKAKK
jgi:DNA-binding NarL/FixJ family response regulator